QVATAKKSRQANCVPAIGLHPIASSVWYLRGCHNPALDTGRAQVPLQPESGWTRLVATANLLPSTELAKPLHQPRRVVRYHSNDAGIEPILVGNRNRDRILVDVKTNEPYLRHGPASFMWHYSSTCCRNPRSKGAL